jgi:hypothetical protein
MGRILTMPVVVVRAVVVVSEGVAEDVVKVVVGHTEVFVGLGLSVGGIKVAVGSVVAVNNVEVDIVVGSASGSLPLVVSNILRCGK